MYFCRALRCLVRNVISGLSLFSMEQSLSFKSMRRDKAGLKKLFIYIDARRNKQNTLIWILCIAYTNSNTSHHTSSYWRQGDTPPLRSMSSILRLTLMHISLNCARCAVFKYSSSWSDSLDLNPTSGFIASSISRPMSSDSMEPTSRELRKWPTYNNVNKMSILTRIN